MLKKIITGFAVVASMVIYGQIGIGTETPSVTLDVVGKPTDTTVLDGIAAPRITGAQLRAKTYTSTQTGTIVYVTTADTAPAGQTIDVTSAGYYYFNGTKWINLRDSGAGTSKILVNANVPGTQNIKNASTATTYAIGNFSIENIDILNSWTNNIFTVPANMTGLYNIIMQNSNYHSIQSDGWLTMAFFEKSTDNGASWSIIMRDTRSSLGGSDIDNGNSLNWTGNLNAGDKIRVRFNCTATTDNIISIGTITITKLNQ